MKKFPYRKLVLAFLLLLTAVGAFLFYELQTFEITLGPISARELEAFGKFIEELERTVRAMEAGKVPWRKIDSTSLGFPEKEARLLELSRVAHAFEFHFGRAPNGVNDLSSWLKDALAKKGARKTFDKLTDGCQIILLSEDSYILNCDGWKAPDKKAIQRLVQNFSAEIIRFFRIGEHVILYVPPYVRNKPLS